MRGVFLIFVFGDCELDLDRFELRRAGRLRPVEPQVFDLLAVLIRERRRVVPKEELLDTVWGIQVFSIFPPSLRPPERAPWSTSPIRSPAARRPSTKEKP